MKKFKKNITKKRKLKSKKKRIHRKTIKKFDGGLNAKNAAALGLGLLSGSQALVSPNSRGLPLQNNMQHSNSLLNNHSIPFSRHNSYGLEINPYYRGNSSGLPPEQPPTYNKWISFDEHERHVTPTDQQDNFKEIVNKFKQGRVEDYSVAKIKEYTGQEADNIFGKSDIISSSELMDDFVTNPPEQRKSVKEITKNIRNNRNSMSRR